MIRMILSTRVARDAEETFWMPAAACSVSYFDLLSRTVLVILLKVVGPESETLRRTATVRDCVWGPFEALAGPAEVAVKVRSAARQVAATVVPLDGGRCRVDLAEPVSAVAPGQSAVFYDGETVLGGGVIESAA